MLYALLASPFILIGGWFLLIDIQKRLQAKRRKRLTSRPFPAQWRETLQQHFPLYRRLPEALQSKLESYVQIFVDEKVFVGCGGMQITDEVRLLIAAQACLLILNNARDIYPGFTTILVYPDVYQAQAVMHDGMVTTRTHQHRAGESWSRGPVILAWGAVFRGAMGKDDGTNVVFHEFAHKLDEEDTVMDGTPILENAEQYHAWVKVFSQEYHTLIAQIAEHHAHVIDDYAAQSPAEFFAVVSEMFFEKPKKMKRHHAQLYEQLQGFYQLDPDAWHKHNV